MAPAGFVTHMHYDIFDNFYLQVDGVKQFDLALAASHTLLHLYPITHQRTRLVQMPLDGDTVPEDWNLPEPIFLLRATLEPGDLLFLPAFTFHQVALQCPGGQKERRRSRCWGRKLADAGAAGDGVDALPQRERLPTQPR
jgi:ribosomal protein L16 Arg81 hydroxylase